MKIRIVVDRYYLDIGDILKGGEVCFDPDGQIRGVEFATKTGTLGVGGMLLDEHIEKEKQSLIEEKIRIALIEIKKQLSGFEEIANNLREPRN